MHPRRPPAPELSVRTCQMKVTARHVQCAKSNMCAAVAAHARVLRGFLPDEDIRGQTERKWGLIRNTGSLHLFQNVTKLESKWFNPLL